MGNNYITVSDLNARVSKMPSYYRQAVEKNKKRYLEEMVAEELFYDEAIRDGINKDEEVKELVKEATKKIIIAKFIKTEVDDKAAVSEDDLKRFYELHKAEFKTPEIWRASHILVATDVEARDVLDQLAKGASFEELAKMRSMDATASRGGDIGYFKQGQPIPDFEKVTMALEVGQVSGVVHTQFGYHIIKLTDKKAAGSDSYENARPAIEAELKKGKRRVMFEELLAKLKEKYGVEIHEPVLKSLDAPAGKEASKQ